jgi:DNA-binding response OmpR family regulator
MRRVLIIEDDSKDTAVTRSAVVRAGFFPDCAATGEEAISCLLRTGYTYILMEPAVGRIDLPLIISMAGKQKVPIVVVTKDASLIRERSLREMGILYYMVKPANALELSMVLQNDKCTNL